MCRIILNLSITFLLFVFPFPALVIAATSDSDWAVWFENQIKRHPSVIAASELRNSSFSFSDGLDRPLYNPQVGAQVGREGKADDYSLSLSQTFDWTDKRSVRQQQAVYSRTAAAQFYKLTLQQKKTEALQAIQQWQAAVEQAELNRTLEAQLETLLDLVMARQEAGDLGQIDAELTVLNLSQRLSSTAQSQAELKQAESRVHELLPDWTEELGQIPASLWRSNLVSGQAEQRVDEHPLVRTAKAEWEILQQSAELARRATKADPTFGINAGELGQDNVLALTFSMPLNIRNNFSAQARASSQVALSAEAQYRAVRRQQLFSIEAARSTLQEYQLRYDRWQSLMQGRVESSGALLASQWNSGDLSTTEYLLALQQRTDGLVSGIELRKLYESARLNWLFQTGQIDDALKELSQ